MTEKLQAKGWLISKCPFGGFKSTKNPTDFLSASKKRLNKKTIQLGAFFDLDFFLEAKVFNP